MPLPSAPTIHTDAIEAAVGRSAEDRKTHVTSIALTAGLTGGAKVAAFSIPAALLLNKYYKPFTTRLNVSARTAVAITPPLFAFGLISEQVASRLANPKAYETFVAAEAETTKISFIHRVANYFYLNPVKCLVYTSVPTVAAIYLTRDAENLNLSQRVMHTRVLGQASVLAILASTMFFHDWMERRGLYTE